MEDFFGDDNLEFGFISSSKSKGKDNNKAKAVATAAPEPHKASLKTAPANAAKASQPASKSANKQDSIDSSDAADFKWETKPTARSSEPVTAARAQLPKSDAKKQAPVPSEPNTNSRRIGKTYANSNSDENMFNARPKELFVKKNSASSTLVASKSSASRPELTIKPIFTRISFSDASLKLNPWITTLLEKPSASLITGGFGLKTCTTVQSVSIPLISTNHNVLIKSQTGSGKTLAYLLPIVNELLNEITSASATGEKIDYRKLGTRALIIAPTRELCAQISDVIQKLSQVHIGIVGGAIIGGEKKKSEKARLRKGVSILVGTPGRLLDHLKTTESFVCKNLRWLVFDEADRLLDMGFEKAVLEICAIVKGTAADSSSSLKSILPTAVAAKGIVQPGNDDDDEDEEKNDNKDDDDEEGEEDQQDHNSKKGSKQVQSKQYAQRFAQQLARISKQCVEPDRLVHVLVSATLSAGVQKLVGPVLLGSTDDVSDSNASSSNATYSIIDADNNRVQQHHVGKDTASQTEIEREDGRSSKKQSLKEKEKQKPARGIVSFDDDEEEDSPLSAAPPLATNSNSYSKSDHNNENDENILSSGQIEMPTRLQQYYMTVTSKWRLSALLSFLYTHRSRPQQDISSGSSTLTGSKIVVFFATCDSVDYHSLLFRESKWPSEDNCIDFNFGNRSSSSSSSSGGSGRKDWTLDTNDDSNSNSNYGGSKRAAGSGASSSSMPAAHKLPVEGLTGSSFTGILGSDTKIFRFHGNMPQQFRLQVYREFCAASSGVLLCTDVAARGLDLPDVDWILQYDAPCDTADYVHRAGRTARKGGAGNSLLFLLPTEAQYVNLLNSHGVILEQLSLQQLFMECSTYVPSSKKFANKDELTAVILQKRIERTVNVNATLIEAGRQAFRSFIRAYATHSVDTKGIFAIQQLHLGHVCKSFGLLENPHTMRNHDDIIGKIMNGDYSTIANEERKRKLTKEERDEKYALSNQRGNYSGKGNQSKNRSQSAERGQSRDNRDNRDNRKRSSSAMQSDESSEAASTATASNTRDTTNRGPMQKVRKLDNKKQLTASGKFRKSEGGYFRKKLREQHTSEFVS